jgi:glycosyltransferase involved in cell wall biosynthesis
MVQKTDIILSLHATREYPAETYFLRCIETLRQTLSHECYRLILVDDACDEVAEKVISDIAKVEQCVLIKTNKQRWFTRAYNAGLRMARTPWVVLLNADTELGDGWLEELYDVKETFEQNTGRKVGLVGSVQSEPEQRRFAESVNPDYVTGHCWLVSMQALSDVSSARGTPGIYLDETRQDCIHIRSDVAMSWELNKARWATVKSFKSAVGHHGFKSWGANVPKVDATQLKDVEW